MLFCTLKGGEMMSSNFGDLLRELREARGMAVNQLAMYSGVSSALISKIENNKRGKPKPETLKKIAKGLKMDYEDLMFKAGYLPLSEGKTIYHVDDIGDPGSDDRERFIKKFLTDFETFPPDMKKRVLQEMIGKID
jgi:transcriptional regulator with XRE-family HTH domain